MTSVSMPLISSRVGRPGPGPELTWLSLGAAAARLTRLRAPGARRPVVLILDDFGYELFDQIAAALRRRGVGCIRLTSGRAADWRRDPPSRIRRLRDLLFYDATVALTRPACVGPWRKRDHGLRIADVLISETTAASMGLEHPWLATLAVHGRAFRALPPQVLLDKFEVNARLAAAGVRVPDQLSAAEADPAEAGRRLGLPVVVKARAGLGGDAVRIARSAAEIPAAVADHEAAPERLFFQRFLPGDIYGYGCLLGENGPLMEHGFRIGARQWPQGPALNVVLEDDPALVTAGRRVAEALGCEGLAHFEFMKDETGELLPIDINLRPWDEQSLLGADIDYATAYADLLLGRPARARPRAPDVAGGRRVSIYPAALYDAARNGEAELGAVAGVGRMCWRGPGAAYGALIGTKAAAILAKRFGARVARLIPHPAREKC